MPLPTETINIDIDIPNGSEFTSASLHFTLSGPDSDSGTGIVLAPHEVVVNLDGNGQGTAGLWPVDGGINGRFYTVTLFGFVTNSTDIRQYVLGRIQPLDGGGPYSLAELLQAGGAVAGPAFYSVITEAQYAAIIAAAAQATASAAAIAASGFFQRETEAPGSVQDQIGAAIGQNEAQAALGINPRRALYNTNGTHIVDARNFSPALNYILLPAAGSATLDCASLFYNVPYDFISGTGGTTVTLDFGEDVFVRSPHISAGVSTIRTVALPPNQRVTVIRLGGNQVFVDYGAPPYEEGLWTPEVQGLTTAGTQTYGLRAARWSRMGSLVTFNAEIRMSSTSGAAGQVIVSGLPYVARGTANDAYPVTVPYWLNLTSPISGGDIPGGTSHLVLWRENGGDCASLDASELENGTRLIVGGSYLI